MVRPPAPGCPQRQFAELGEVHSEHPRRHVQHAGCVQRADQGQELPGQIRESGDDARRVVGLPAATGEHRARCSQRHRPHRSRPRHRTRPLRCHHRQAPKTSRPASVDHLGRPGHPRQQHVPTEGEHQQVTSVVPGPRIEVAGPATRRSGRSPGHRMVVEPESLQVSQSCGRQTAATRAAFAGSCSASQRSLVMVNDATGTSADRLGPLLRTELGDQVVGGLGRAGVVPQQRRPHHRRRPRRGRPCRAAGRRRRARRRRPGRPAARPPRCRASHQAAGSTSVPSGWPARPCADQRTGLGVPDHDLAGLGGRIHPCNQGHAGATFGVAEASTATI